jgi:hypothetical protein
MIYRFCRFCTEQEAKKKKKKRRVLLGEKEGSRRNQNGFHPLSGLFEPPEGEYIRILGK